MLFGNYLQKNSYCLRNCQQWMYESSIPKAHISLYRKITQCSMSPDAALDETLFLSWSKKFISLPVLAVVLMVQCCPDIILELYSGHGWRHLGYELHNCTSAVITILSTCLDATFSTSSGIPVYATSTSSSCPSSVFISYATRQSLMECHGILELFMEVSSIAWGQATFFGGGTVTSGTMCEVGLDVIGHGPEMGWLVDDNKGEAAQEKGIEQKLNQSLKLLCSRFSLPTPTSPMAALHKR
jgi:hypothetical protein